MSEEAQVEESVSALSDGDQERINAVLKFWFKEHELSAPQVDGRMDVWFGEDPLFDEEIVRTFAVDVEKASEGELDHWAFDARGRLALIILLDQFTRNIHRGTARAFSNDALALKLCVDGAGNNMYRSLAPIQQVFFFMPLQHAESQKLQEKSVSIYQTLARNVSETQRETFQTTAHFAELHRDIVEQFGRFPHRNKVLGRENTAAEEAHLNSEARSFGQ